MKDHTTMKIDTFTHKVLNDAKKLTGYENFDRIYVFEYC